MDALVMFTVIIDKNRDMINLYCNNIDYRRITIFI